MTVRSSVEIDDLLSLTIQELIQDQSFDTQGLYSVSDSFVSSALSNLTQTKNQKPNLQSGQLSNSQPFIMNPNNSNSLQNSSSYNVNVSNESKYGQQQKENVDTHRRQQQTNRYDNSNFRSDLLRNHEGHDNYKQDKQRKINQINDSQSFDSQIYNKSNNDINYSEYSPSTVKDSVNFRNSDFNGNVQDRKYNNEMSSQGLNNNSNLFNIGSTLNQQFSGDFYKAGSSKQRHFSDVFMQNSMMFNQDNVQLESPQITKQGSQQELYSKQWSRKNNGHILADPTLKESFMKDYNQISESQILEKDMQRILSQQLAHQQGQGELPKDLQNYTSMEENKKLDSHFLNQNNLSKVGKQGQDEDFTLNAQQSSNDQLKSHPLKVGSQAERSSLQSSGSIHNNVSDIPSLDNVKSQTNVVNQQARSCQQNNTQIQKDQLGVQSVQDYIKNQQSQENNSDQNSQPQVQMNSLGFGQILQEDNNNSTSQDKIKNQLQEQDVIQPGNQNLNSYVLTSEQLQQATPIVKGLEPSMDQKSDTDIDSADFQDMDIDDSNYTDPQQSTSNSQATNHNKKSSSIPSLFDVVDNNDINQMQGHESMIPELHQDPRNQILQKAQTSTQDSQLQDQRNKETSNQDVVNSGMLSNQDQGPQNEDFIIDQNTNSRANTASSFKIYDSKLDQNKNKFEIQSLDWAQKEPKSNHLKQFFNDLSDQQRSKSSLKDDIFKCQQNFLNFKLSEERLLPNPNQIISNQIQPTLHSNLNSQSGKQKQVFPDVIESQPNKVVEACKTETPPLKKESQIDLVNERLLNTNNENINTQSPVSDRNNLQVPQVQNPQDKLEDQLQMSPQIHSKDKHLSTDQSQFNIQSMDPYASLQVQVPLQYLQSSMHYQQKKFENNASDPKEIVIIQQEILQRLNKLMIKQQQEIQNMYNFFQLENQVSKFVTEQLMLKLRQASP